MEKLVFFLGGNDAEMVEILKVLTQVGAEVNNSGLGWGAHASSYAAEIAKASAEGKKIVLVELDNTHAPKTDWSEEKVAVVLPKETIVVDHHGNRANEPASILQVLNLLDLAPTRWQQLIAANDSGYIPSLTAMGATAEEIAAVRLADRFAQGITPEQEASAEAAIAGRKADGRLTVVNLPHSKCATVTDRLFGQYDQLLILSGDGEVNFYGDGMLCAVLKERFEGWNGGSGLGEHGGSAFWGGYPNQVAVENFIREKLCPRVIIFGAPDIEEQRARRIAAIYGLQTATATFGGERCNPMTAYRADGYILDSADESGDAASECIIFECSPKAAGDLVVVAQCDHHNPGDHGFGLSSAEYLEASSLGQLLNFLGVEATQEDRVIAAADHCLGAAYQGECPGVSAEKVLAMRLPEIMKRENVSSEAEAIKGIEAAVKLLKNPEMTVTLGGILVADVRDLGPIPFLVEAGVMTSTPYLAKGDKRFPDKVNLSGSYSVVAEFLGEAEMVEGRPTYPHGWAATNGLFQAYGNAGRGFAGAYDKLQA